MRSRVPRGARGGHTLEGRWDPQDLHLADGQLQTSRQGELVGFERQLPAS